MIDELKKSKVYFPKTIVTQLRQASEFWRAE
jgi:peptide methionine sulfoxide reductase MsrA